MSLHLDKGRQSVPPFGTVERARIDQLTQSILAKAFRGELAPQDPNDELASVLLERIKTQREAEPKARRSRKKVLEA